MEIHTTVFVEVEKGKTRLEADPANKEGRFQKLFDGPARKVGWVFILVMLVITTVYCRSIWNEPGLIHLFGNPRSNVAPINPSVTLTKNIWSQRVEIPPGKIFAVISITPLVKRVVMVNGDPNRVYSLPASVSNDVNLGTNVRFLQWMIDDPSELYASAVLEYTLR